MSSNKEVYYKPYEHKFEEDNLVKLKQHAALAKIKIMVNNDILSADEDALVPSWFLTPQKEEKLNSSLFEVINCISWHMGIPFYRVKLNEEHYEIAEFYIETK